MKYLDILNRGGMFMYPILIVSIVGLTIVGERVYALFYKLRLNTREFTQRVCHSVEGGHVNRALSFCSQFIHHPLAKVMNAGLLKANRGDKEIERAMEGAFLEEAPVVQKRVGTLSMLANVSTLLGLLGTIFGLIQAFRGVTMGEMAKEELAKGIAVAMSTTAFGLIVAIPLLIAFHVLSNRQNKILDAMQHGATKLLNLISGSNRDLRAGPRRVSEAGKRRGK